MVYWASVDRLDQSPNKSPERNGVWTCPFGAWFDSWFIILRATVCYPPWLSLSLDRKRGRLDCSRFRFLVVAALMVADVVYHPVVATEAF